MPSEEKDVNDMPIWQNHEQRITQLEVTTANIKTEFKDIKEMINKGNSEQSKKLEIIDKRLMDEFFTKKNRNHENVWRLILKITGIFVGGGSFLYLILERIFGG